MGMDRERSKLEQCDSLHAIVSILVSIRGVVAAHAAGRDNWFQNPHTFAVPQRCYQDRYFASDVGMGPTYKVTKVRIIIDTKNPLGIDPRMQVPHRFEVAEPLSINHTEVCHSVDIGRTFQPVVLRPPPR